MSKIPRPRVTIITPSFNQAQFLEQTIRSVVSQKNLCEYLIFDGGSTDGSLKIIKRYAKKYPSLIKWTSGQDKGQVDAINQGLKKASGDIVAYLNSDDYYLPGALAKVATYFESHENCQWLVGDCAVSQKNLAWTFFIKHLWPIDRHPIFLKVYNTINQPAVFIRCELVNQVGSFNQKYHYAFDYDYWLRCLKFGTPGRLHRKLAAFRVHHFSKGNTGFIDQFAEDQIVAYRQSKSQSIAILHFVISRLTILAYNILKK